MKNSFAIARREFGAYFNSPIAYIFIVVFLLISGYMFFTEITIGTPQADMRPLFGLAPLIFCIFAPLMTMGLFAEEKATGTLEMLLTLPVTDWEVVIGKFLGAVSVFTVMILLTLPYVAFVAAYGNLDKGPMIGGYLGLVLMASGYIAIGVMTSTWTKNQIVAAIISFLICFGLFLAGKLLQVLPQWLAPTVQAVSSDYHFQSISRGVVDLRDLFYYASLVVISLLIAQTSLESRRWR